MAINTIKKAYVDTSGGQIHYRYTTGEGTPLVLLHQTASSGARFEKIMHRLEGLAPMYAFDTPGFGGSFDPEDYPDMPQYGRWLSEAIDGCGLDSFHVLGHHTGVCIGGEIAAAHRGRVKSFSMIGPVPLTKDEREEFRQHFSTPISPTEDGSYLQATWDYLVTLGVNQDPELHHREVLDTVRAWLGRSKAYGAVWDQDFTQMYAEFSCPLLLMCARDDVLWPFFERAREQRPDARAVEIKGANFEPDLDPDGVAGAVRDFLQGIAA